LHPTEPSRAVQYPYLLDPGAFSKILKQHFSKKKKKKKKKKIARHVAFWGSVEAMTLEGSLPKQVGIRTVFYV